MSYYFISDLHLQEGEPAIGEKFLELIATRPAADDTLFILGDLFEVWLGDDHDTEFNRAMISGLAAMTARGTRLCLMHGNRDFLLGSDFCAATGGQLLEDPTLVDCFGRRALLMHGDSLCTRDVEYMKARTTLRDAAFQREFLHQSLEERAAFAANARMESKAHTSTTGTEIMDVTPEAVINVMQQPGVDLLIHGHTHRPRVHQVELVDRSAPRIVLGDWSESGWLLEFDAKGFELRSFPIENRG